MKVLHVVEALATGTSRHVIDIVRHARDVEHVVACSHRLVGTANGDSALGELRAAGADVAVVPMRRLPPHPRNVAALARLDGMIAELRPAVIHGHAAIGGALARLAGRRRSVPVVYTPNGLLPSPAALAVERALGRWTAAFVAVSPSEADVVRARRLVDPDRLVTIPNGVELATPAPAVDLRSLLGLGPSALVVGMAGRLEPQKAPVDFVRACAEIRDRLPNVRFALLGDGSLRPAVEDAARALGLGDDLRVLGHVPDVGSALGQLSAFVLTSRYEGGPYAPLEAMRDGVPVVLTDVTGNRDVVEHGVSGFLVPPSDPHALAEAVVAVLDGSVDVEAVGAAARERVRARFDVRAMAQAIEDVYRKVAAGTALKVRGTG